MIGQEWMASRGGLDWVLGKMSSPKGLSSIEESAQGNGGVPSLEGFKRCGCGTWGCDLVLGLAMLGQ